MEYLILALAVFWIVNLIQRVVETYEWVWPLVTCAVSTVALVPWNQSWLTWYTPFALAGLVMVLQTLENYLIVRSDEALTAVMKATARRPK